MTLSPSSLPPGLALRRAATADNSAILEFMGRQSISAGLALRFDRSPDYFSLHNAHSPDNETWLLEKENEILGVGSFVVREAWVNGQRQPCVYMADLRFARRRHAAGLWRPLMQKILTDIRSRTGAQYAWCSILRDNKSGRQALLRSHEGKHSPFRHLRGYTNVSIFARKPLVFRQSLPFSVRRAVNADAEPLRSFIDTQSRLTFFGPVFDQRYWRHRLDTWPDFALENFFLATDDNGHLLGCLAPWDSSTINRIVIEQLTGAAEWVRRLCNVLSPITRRPKVATGSGTHLPDIALTHVFIADRAAEVLSALLTTAVQDIFADGRHTTVSLCVYDEDSLAQALQNFWKVSVPMDLFWVDIGELAGERRSVNLFSERQSFPGFESYLV